jgi:hypothetical protein
MPNVKIYVDEDILAEHKAALTQVLKPLRKIVAQRLEVPNSACQLALIPVIALNDQPAVNVEIHIMPRAGRTPKALETMGTEIQQMLKDVTGKQVAFRCAQLDPTTYVTLK